MTKVQERVSQITNQRNVDQNVPARQVHTHAHHTHMHVHTCTHIHLVYKLSWKILFWSRTVC